MFSAVFSSLTNWNPQPQEGLGCPVCGGGECSYQHPLSVAVNQNGNLTTITGDGTENSLTGPSGRGSIIVLWFWCESCQHKWTLRFAFHKGQTFLAFDDNGLNESPTGGFWRD